MRILMSSLICVGIFCAAFSLRADDNAAQAAARAALMQKMQELDSQPGNSASTPAPNNQASTPASAETNPVPENQAPPATAPSSENTVPPAAEPTPSTVAPTETPSAPAVETAPSAPTPVDVEPQTQQSAETTPMATAPAAASPTNEDSVEMEEQAIIAKHAAEAAPAPAQSAQTSTSALPVMNEMAPPPPQTAMPAPQRRRGFFSRILHPFGDHTRPAVVEEQRIKSASQNAAQNYSAKTGFAPIVPPPPPVSPEQDAQLQALLEKYKANQISPEEYQTERAEIIGNR